MYPEAKLEIENGLHQLETLLEANVDKAFDKFEIYVLRNILTVPEDLLAWVRLKHYEVRALVSVLVVEADYLVFATLVVIELTGFFSESVIQSLAKHPHA